MQNIFNERRSVFKYNNNNKKKKTFKFLGKSLIIYLFITIVDFIANISNPD